MDQFSAYGSTPGFYGTKSPSYVGSPSENSTTYSLTSSIPHISTPEPCSVSSSFDWSNTATNALPSPTLLSFDSAPNYCLENVLSANAAAAAAARHHRDALMARNYGMRQQQSSPCSDFGSPYYQNVRDEALYAAALDDCSSRSSYMEPLTANGRMNSLWDDGKHIDLNSHASLFSQLPPEVCATLEEKRSGRRPSYGRRNRRVGRTSSDELMFGASNSGGLVHNNSGGRMLLSCSSASSSVPSPNMMSEWSSVASSSTSSFPNSNSDLSLMNNETSNYSGANSIDYISSPAYNLAQNQVVSDTCRFYRDLARMQRLQDEGLTAESGHVLGVHWDANRKRWYAMWYSAVTGRKTKRSFSVGKYGSEQARLLAIAARQRGIEENIRVISEKGQASLNVLRK